MRGDVRRALRGVLLVIALAWLFLAAAVIAGASHAAAATGDPALEQRRATKQTSVDAVAQTVMCPSCDTTLDRSSSPSAERMRAWIRSAVDAGWTKDEIRDGLVVEYGGDESVLATPRVQGLGAVAWYVPLAIVLVLASVGGMLVRRWRRSSSTRVNPGGAA